MSERRPFDARRGTNFLKTYRPYIIVGVAFLGIAIAYHLYSRRASQQKTGQQIETGLAAIGAHVGAPPLQVDPQVIESLQNQVLSYQEQVGELEKALSMSNQQVETLIKSTPPPMSPEMAQMQAMQAQQQQGQQQAQFSGLHGQMPPPQGQPGMQPQGQGMPLGIGMPQGPGMPPVPPRNMPAMNGPGGPGVGMGAFADNGPAPALSGMGSAMGGMDLNAPSQDGVTSMAMQMGGNSFQPGQGGGASYSK